MRNARIVRNKRGRLRFAGAGAIAVIALGTILGLGIGHAVEDHPGRPSDGSESSSGNDFVPPQLRPQVSASPVDPAEKLAYLTKHPSPHPRDLPPSLPPEGIINVRQSPFGLRYYVLNRYQSRQGPILFQVFAGAREHVDGIGRSLLVLDHLKWRTGTLSNVQEYPAPRGLGPLKIVSIKNGVLGLKARTGERLGFDLDALTYTSS